MTDEQLKITIKNFSNNLTNSSKSMLEASKRIEESANKFQIGGQKTKDFVRREDPQQRLIKEVDNLEELMEENNRLQREKIKASKKGLWGLLTGLTSAGLTVGGLLGFLFTGKKQYLMHLAKGFLKYGSGKFLMKFTEKIVRSFGGLMVKGFKKLKFGKLFEPISKRVGNLFKPLTKTITKNFDSLIKPIGKNIGKFFKPITGILTKNLDFLIKPFGKIFGKGLMKTGFKSIAKGGGKAVLKKIPIVGGLIGLFFGIQRFKQGDWLGGILEVASGVSSVVPGIGTALSIAIDAFLLFRDLKTDFGPVGKPKNIKPNKRGPTFWRKMPIIGPIMDIIDGFKWWQSGDKSKAFRSFFTASIGINPLLAPFADRIAYPVFGAIENFANTAIPTISKIAKATIASIPEIIKRAKDLPIIGHIMMITEAMVMFPVNPIESIKTVAGIANDIIPGFGDVLLKGLDWMIGLKEFGPIKKIMGGAKKLKGMIKTGASSVGSSIGGMIKQGAEATVGAAKSFGGAVARYASTDIRELPPSAQGEPMAIRVPSTMPMINMMPLKSLLPGGLSQDELSSYGVYKNGKNVNLKGVDKSFLHNFLGMAHEYYTKTGKTIGINSAYRSYQEQKKLKKRKPNLAATPGNSPHEWGFAIDMPSVQANKLASMGLMSKWKMHQPGLNWKNPEAWHIEPLGIDRAIFRKWGAQARQADSPEQIGDVPLSPVNVSIPSELKNVKTKVPQNVGTNLPRFNIPKMEMKNNEAISLTNETISLLGENIGKHFKDALPVPKQNVTMISAETRR